MESLDDVLRSLFEAVLEAQMLTNEQHLEQLSRYFDSDGKPEMFRFQLPGQNPGDPLREVEVPALALSPPSSIKIKDLSISFKVNLGGLGQVGEAKRPAAARARSKAKSKRPVAAASAAEPPVARMRAAFGGLDETNMAVVDVTFDQAVTPEAMHRITDLLSKTLPWT